MFKPRDKQTTFFDATYFCEQLITEDSFYRKFREILARIDEGLFRLLDCKDGRGNLTARWMAKASGPKAYNRRTESCLIKS